MLIQCPECKKPVSEAAPACPGCGFTFSPAVIAAQKETKRKAEQSASVFTVFFVGAIVVLFLVCSGVFSPKSNSSSSPTTSPTDTGTPAFANDKERLEWRSQQSYLPMNEEDKQYELGKLKAEYDKIKNSDRTVGH